MASPLSSLGDGQINMRTPLTAMRNEKMSFANECETPSKHNQSEVIDWDDDVASSPFMTEAAESRVPSKQLPQEIGNDTEIDAIFEDPSTPEHQQSAVVAFQPENDKENMEDPQLQTPAKKLLSPLKARGTPQRASPAPMSRPVSRDAASASPLKPRLTAKTTSRTSSPATSSRPTSRDADSVAMPPPTSTKKPACLVSPRKTANIAAETPLPKSRGSSHDYDKQFDECVGQHVDDTSAGMDETNVDDTCFSTFSVIPEMTLFSKLGETSARKSPLKDQPMLDQATPRPSRKRPSTSRSPSPTPRRLKTPATEMKTPATDKTSNTFLIDFTQQIERFSNAHDRPNPRSPTKSTTEPNLLSYLNNQRSPAKNRMSTPAKSTSLMNLLDFELPPAPTPRSVPSISIRELESMKSSYQSQISSLKATLTGREAEVESLKKAVADAERRVGESLEVARIEKSKREYAEGEKEEWERRGNEVENVLNSVREEVLRNEAEKEDLYIEVEDTKRRAEEAEARILDLDTQLASARAALPRGDGSATGPDEGEVQRLVQARLDAKIEDVSRELHSVYKKKHETKVATLKKSYEARSEKKRAELQNKVEELLRQNEELQATKDSSFSVPSQDDSESRRAIEEQMATIEKQRAQLAGLAEEMKTMKAQQARLTEDLEQERVEKGELVAAVDEMLLLQSTDSGPAAMEDFRKSIQRPSGLRPKLPAFGGAAAAGPAATGAGESRIGRGSGLARPSMGKSKMMSNIERMGRHAE